MPRTGKWLVSISLGLLLVVPSASAQTSSRHKARKVLSQQSVLPPAPRGPLPQVPLDQLPAAPPQVDYQDGRLSIVAQNSTLGDILREVRKRTGASIDVPPSATERVVARLGPAPARDVLATLLNGSSFNYVMVGSDADPSALSSVVLTSRPAAGGTQTVAVVSQPSPVYTPPNRTELGPGMGRPGGFVPPVAQAATPQPGIPEAANGDDSADDSEDADDSDQDTAEGQDQNGGTPQPNAGPKTPEELLQKLQQQRLQQQQQQPGQPPQAPPN
jgi:hypothetical protein